MHKKIKGCIVECLLYSSQEAELMYSLVNKYLWCVYSVLGTVLVSRHTQVNKVD